MFFAIGLICLTPSPRYQNSIYIKVVKKLCAKKLFKQAFEVAQATSQNCNHWKAIELLSLALVKDQRIDDALYTAGTLPEEMNPKTSICTYEARSIVLEEISCEVAKLGFIDKALEITHIIPFPRQTNTEIYNSWKYRAIQTIALECARQGDPVRALEISDSTPLNVFTARTTRSFIAEQYIPIDKDKAVDVFRQCWAKVHDSDKIASFCNKLRSQEHFEDADNIEIHFRKK